MTGQLHPAVLRAFDAGTYLARVTLTGSLHMSLANVPVSRDIPGADMIAGRKVAVILWDPTKPTDAVVAAVWV